MATLVLSTVGTVLGGPVGGAIGSLLGQGVDQQLFGPGPRQGPRLGDLAVQASSYGTAIPRLFGTMRVAGSIVWSTDLQESSQTVAAKGQPDAVTYSYSVSFAVALSSRPIRNVRRIWADGKLIRTAEGTFTVATDFRVYDGSEDQPIDPLIGSVEGLDSTPAYRGVALAVFDNLQLAEFGNRIPSLTFEVEADPAPVPVGDLLGDVSGGIIASAETFTVGGFAAYGSTVADAIEPVVELLGVQLLDDGRSLVSPNGQPINPSIDEVGCGTVVEGRSKSERSQVAARNIPSAIAVAYYDPARDYQSGLARGSIGDGSLQERLELPAVINADEAKALAETCLARRWAERDTVTLRLPPTYLNLSPGSLVLQPGDDRRWRVERVMADSLVTVATLHPNFTSIRTVPADPGRLLPSVAAALYPTALALIELPDDGSGDADAPVVALAASSSGGSWRAVPVQIDIGETDRSSRTASSRSLLGTTLSVLGAGQSALVDLRNSVDVQLVNADQWLESRDSRGLVDGANLAILGSELIQFGDALPLGEGRFRLSRLLRGRRGTEWAMELHKAGETFALLDGRILVPVPLGSSQVGAAVRATPLGLADAESDAVELIASGEAMRPASPVHVRANLTADGSLLCTWVRRSRRGWAWLDGVDVPLDCSAELYRVTLQGSGSSIELETVSPEVEISAAELDQLGAGTINIAVVQVGDFAVSRPATLTISMN